MIAKYRRKALVFGVPGLLMQVVSTAGIVLLNYMAARAGHAPDEWISNLLTVGYYGGTLVLIIGLCEYADAKGQSRIWAAFAIASVVGLVILLCLKDKTKDQGY